MQEDGEVKVKEDGEATSKAVNPEDLEGTEVTGETGMEEMVSGLLAKKHKFLALYPHPHHPLQSQIPFIKDGVTGLPPPLLQARAQSPRPQLRQPPPQKPSG